MTPALPSHPTVSADRAVLPRLLAQGLACRRGRRLLFQGLELALEPGDIWWVRGANGRGKTSLLRLLTGLSSPESGELRWGEGPLRSAGPAFRERLLYIGHANGLKDELSVLESLRFLARIHGRPTSAAALEQALDTLGLRSRRDAAVRTLSQGQKRRVALARLALDLQAGGSASLWVLDEPFDALDADGIEALNGLLRAQARRGGSVVLTSHLPLSLDDPAPRVLQLDALRAPVSHVAAAAEPVAAAT